MHTIVKVPELLKDIECVPLKSDFGKFFRKYRESKKENTLTTNKIECIKNLTQMSKMRFLHEFMLNDSYQFEDFINIRNVSLRGFVYEAVWDICFKCGVVNGFNRTDVTHLKGKIEDLRYMTQKIKEDFENKIRESSDPSEKEHLISEKESALKNVFKKQWSSLKIVKNLETYLMESKVQSGNSAGISDISMKDGNKFVFVSSKYYTNEKAITDYDIESIVQAVRGLNIQYDVVLVVRNKRRLMEKIRATHKKHVVESITNILDVEDLKNALFELRRTFVVYPNFFSVRKTEISHYDLLNYYFVLSTKNLVSSNCNIVLWNCVDMNVLNQSVELYAKMNPDCDCKRVTTSQFESLSSSPMSESRKKVYFILLKDHESLLFDYNKVIDSNDRNLRIYLLPTYLSLPKTQVNIGFLQVLPTEDITAEVTQSVKESLLKHFGSLEQKHYPPIRYFRNKPNNEFNKSNNFKRYENLYSMGFDVSKVFTKDRYTQEESAKLIECLFGTKTDIHEKYIFLNRLKLNQPCSFVCILPTDYECDKFIQTFNMSKYIAKSFEAVGFPQRNIAQREKKTILSGKHFVYVIPEGRALTEVNTPYTSNIIILTKLNIHILKTLTYRICFSLNQSKLASSVNVIHF